MHKTRAHDPQDKKHKQIKAGQPASFLRLFTSQAKLSLTSLPQWAFYLYMIFYFRKNSCCILVPLMQREWTQAMFVERMNFLSNEVYIPLPGKPFSVLLSLLHFLFPKPQRPHFTQSPHLSFTVLCSLASALIFQLYHLLTAPLGKPPAVLDVQLLTDPGTEKDVHTEGCPFLTCSHLHQVCPCLNFQPIRGTSQPVSGLYRPPLKPCQKYQYFSICPYSVTFL